MVTKCFEYTLFLCYQYPKRRSHYDYLVTLRLPSRARSVKNVELILLKCIIKYWICLDLLTCPNRLRKSLNFRLVYLWDPPTIFQSSLLHTTLNLRGWAFKFYYRGHRLTLRHFLEGFLVFEFRVLFVNPGPPFMSFFITGLTFVSILNVELNI